MIKKSYIDTSLVNVFPEEIIHESSLSQICEDISYTSNSLTTLYTLLLRILSYTDFMAAN